jgi:hypothetical protein
MVYTSVVVKIGTYVVTYRDPVGSADFSEELHHFNHATGAWTSMRNQTSGHGPSPRLGNAVACAGGGLFVRGGIDNTGVQRAVVNFFSDSCRA